MTAPVCPLCQSNQTGILQTGVREDPNVPVYGCSNCGFQYLTPPHGDFHAYYHDEYRLEHSNKPGQVISQREDFDLMRPFMDEPARRFKEVVPKGATVLEVGCSSGFFLDAIKDDYSVYGNEWNPNDAAFVRDELGLPCSEDDICEAFGNKKFAAIVGLQVLEHVEDPIAWLRKVKDKLIGGGWVYFEVPNVQEMLQSVYDVPEFREWYYRIPHVSYFNMHTLSSALGVVGFEARVMMRQRYPLSNHLRWVLGGGRAVDQQTARATKSLVPEEHPAHALVQMWWKLVERQYGGLVDTLQAADTLVAIGRKREI